MHEKAKHQFMGPKSNTSHPVGRSNGHEEILLKSSCMLIRSLTSVQTSGHSGNILVGFIEFYYRSLPQLLLLGYQPNVAITTY